MEYEDGEECSRDDRTPLAGGIRSFTVTIVKKNFQCHFVFEDGTEISYKMFLLELKDGEYRDVELRCGFDFFEGAKLVYEGTGDAETSETVNPKVSIHSPAFRRGWLANRR